MEEKQFDDILLVAYLKLKGIPVEPTLSSDGFVSFKTGTDAEEALAAYYDNEPVGVLSFSKCVKDVKTMMYRAKKGDGNGN